MPSPWTVATIPCPLAIVWVLTKAGHALRRPTLDPGVEVEVSFPTKMTVMKLILVKWDHLPFLPE
jgi:hypothetical protein